MASCDMEAAPLGDLAAADPVRLINADWSPELPDPTSPDESLPAAADVQQHTSGITTTVPEPEGNEPGANEDTSCEEEDFEGLLYASRDEAIAMAFASVDANKDGKIDASELRALVPLISPAHNKNKSVALLKALDDNEDGAISLTEWTAALQAMLPEGLDLHAFDQFMAPLILKGSAYLSDPTNDAAAPQWPLGSRAYLQTALGSALQDGLAALLEHMAVEHVKVASGEQWDADGCLPIGYTPDRPLRWLGEWLQSNNDFVEEEEDPRLFDWSRGVPWSSLNKKQRFRIAFEHMDKDNSGYLDLAEVENLVATFAHLIKCGSARDLMAQMDLDSNEQIDLAEFEEYMDAIFLGLDQDAVRDQLHPILDGYFLSTLDSQAQLREVFSRVAVQRSDDSCAAIEWPVLMAMCRHLSKGVLTNEALNAQLSKVANPEGLIQEHAVIEALTEICEPIRQSALPDRLAQLLSGVVELDAAAKLGSAFRAHVMALPLAGQVPSVSVAGLKAMMAGPGINEVIPLDCRTEPETMVSTIMEALLVDMLKDPSSDCGFAPDTEALQHAMQAIQESMEIFPRGKPLVVVFCTDGSRSLPVALQLCIEFLDVPIVHLCGGIIAWYNAGEAVEDCKGCPVDSVHTGPSDLVDFIDRPNEFISCE